MSYSSAYSVFVHTHSQTHRPLTLTQSTAWDEKRRVFPRIQNKINTSFVLRWQIQHTIVTVANSALYALAVVYDCMSVCVCFSFFSHLFGHRINARAFLCIFCSLCHAECMNMTKELRADILSGAKRQQEYHKQIRITTGFSVNRFLAVRENFRSIRETRHWSAANDVI